MRAVIGALLLLAAASVGLRTTAFFVSDRINAYLRLAIALAAGSVITAAILELFNAYRIFDFGLGLMLSLSPMGPYDLARWWFRSRRR
jgi:hypothetical protein